MATRPSSASTSGSSALASSAPAEEPRKRKRWTADRWFAIWMGLAALATLLAALAVSLFQVIHCTDGDGGAPYVARASPLKGVCNATLNGLLLIPLDLLLIVPLLWFARRVFRARSRRKV